MTLEIRNPLSRRTFVLGGTSAVALALATPNASALTIDGVAGSALAGQTVLFQGDSITDTGRSRTNTAANIASALGNGYPLLIASELMRAHPGNELRFLNRGISGNRIPDLTARWTDDAIALKPDVLSILIGVNDLWHKIMGRSNGTVDEYEQGYNALLEQTHAALPATRLVVLEPFVLRTGQVTDKWFPEFDERRAAAKRVATKHKAKYVELHAMFEKLSSKTPPAYWAADGVHPTPAGHAAIAREWMKAVRI